MHLKWPQIIPIDEPAARWAYHPWIKPDNDSIPLLGWPPTRNIKSGNRGIGQWMPFGEFITISFPEPSSLSIELPISENWKFVTVEYSKPGEKPRMTISGEWIELELKMGRDKSLVWSPR